MKGYLIENDISKLTNVHILIVDLYRNSLNLSYEWKYIFSN